MGQKVHPIGFRLGLNQRHKSEWFHSVKAYPELVYDDYKIRQFIFEYYTTIKRERKFHPNAEMNKVRITRNRQKDISLFIYTNNPDPFFTQLTQKNNTPGPKTMCAFRKKLQKITPFPIIHIQLKPAPKVSALSKAISIATQLEQRKPFRPIMRSTLRKIKSENVAGAKIQISGRLNGAEMARSEITRYGQVPLHTLRTRIDYCKHEAHTIYGIIGIKIWIVNAS